MRRIILILIAATAISVASPALAAAPPVGTSVFVDSDESDEVIVVANVNQNAAILVFYSKDSTSNRTVGVTDDGGNTYGLIEALGTCTSERCIEVYADYSVGAANPLTITVDQSGTATSYFVLVVELECAGTCSQDVESGLLAGGAETTHQCSATADVIDTAENATLIVYAQVEAGGSFGTDAPTAGWEEFADGVNLIFAAYEDDVATAFTNERGTFTSDSSTPHCVIVSVTDSGGAGGGLPPSSLSLLGVGK